MTQPVILYVSEATIEDLVKMLKREVYCQDTLKESLAYDKRCGNQHLPQFKITVEPVESEKKVRT